MGVSGCEEGRGVLTPSLLFFLINASTTFRFFLIAKAAVKKGMAAMNLLGTEVRLSFLSVHIG